MDDFFFQRDLRKLKTVSKAYQNVFISHAYAHGQFQTIINKKKYLCLQLNGVESLHVFFQIDIR